MNVKQVLVWGVKRLEKNGHSADLDAELLLLYALNAKPAKSAKPVSSLKHLDKTWLYAHLDENVFKNQLEIFKKYIAERAQGRPVAYITNTKEFYGLGFYVDGRVLIPRPETELLVWLVLKQLTANDRRQTIVIDIGTGCGAIIISIAKNLQHKTNNTKFVASDISQAALEVARLNSRRHGQIDKIDFLQGDLLKPIIDNLKFKNENCDLIIAANLPYLTKSEFDQVASIRHEPKISLVAGSDSLSLIRRLLQQLQTFRKYFATTTVLLEHNPQQSLPLKKHVKQLLFQTQVQTRKDLANRPRVTVLKLL